MTRINTAVGVHPSVTSHHAQAVVAQAPTVAPAAVRPSDEFVHVKLRDASARSAIRRLEKTAGREVSAAELNRAIKVGTADVDGQFTNKEYQDFAAWALRNAGRLSTGAKQVMSLYAKAAKAAHGKPLSSSEYTGLMKDLAAVKDTTAKPTKKTVLDDPERWFISQRKTREYNSREDNGFGNCGPTSLTMIARAFGKVRGGPAQMDAAIEQARRRMHAGTNENMGTGIDQIKHGAEEHYGLKTRRQTGKGSNTTRRLNDTIEHIKNNLAKGRPVIVHGVMIRAPHDRGGYGEGGHYFVVTKISKNKHGEWVARLNDPNWPDGPRTVPLSRLRESIRRRGTFATLAIWDK